MDFPTQPTQRLAALELQGYKSFATKTRFEFAPTVTAVVGPNGSGKSNIADAIRWVLGEQSYSLLRGRKTEDMIFNGSESRPRAGMASATITFDNSDGWLPIEFSEVTVSRRAYRDGQNEYILNGQRVRLRDVEALLAESGLAQRTYTIIGQGLVDAVLALKAEDRRKIFEEAAGIGLHRSRREEAVRRLLTTQRNLERVADIMAELKPRLRSLERQAKHAEAYHQVRKDLLAALRIWYGYHWYQGQSTLQEAEEEARVAQSARDSILKSQELHNRELGEARQKTAAMRVENRELEVEIVEARTAKESAARELAVIEARAKWLEDQESLLQEEIRSSQQSLVEAEGHLRSIIDEEARLQERASELQGELEQLRSDSDSQEDELQSAAQFREKVQKDAVAKASYEALQARLIELKESSASIEEELTEKRDQLRRAQDKLRELETSLQEALERETELTSILQQSRADLDGDNKERESALVRRYELLNLIGEKRSKAETLRGMQGYLEKSRQEILAVIKSGELKGFDRLLFELVDIPENYRLAIASALGVGFSGVMLQDRDELDSALDRLSGSGERSPIALVHYAQDRTLPSLAVPDDPGCLGLASDVVTAPEPIADVVKSLLGRTLLMKDRGAVRRVLADLPPDAKLVTLDGELHYANGLVELPGDVSPRSSNFQETASQLDSDVQEAESQTVELEESTQALESRIKGLRIQIEERSAEEEELRIVRAELEGETLQGRMAVNGLEEEIARLEARSSEIAFQIEAGQASLDDQLSRMAASTIPGSPLNRLMLDEDSSELMLTDLGTVQELDAVEMAIAGIQTRREDRTQRVSQLQNELEARNGRLNSNQVERESLANQHEQKRLTLQEGERLLKDLMEGQRQLENRLTETIDQRSKLEAEESKSLVELHHAEQRNTELQITLARNREEMHNLERRILDDFGLVTFDNDEAMMLQAPLPLKGLVEHLNKVASLPSEHETQMNRLRAQLRRMGAVNPEAQQEYEEVRDRVDFLETQTGDLEGAEKKLQRVVQELDALMAQEFVKTYEAVTIEFKKAFQRLFQGGSANLVLQQGEDLSSTGIDIEVRLPGRREQGLAMLSGGERSLTAAALIFALLKVSPTPFCVLDEVDAMLDESNVMRFGEMLQELSAETQFCVITHNRLTIQHADVIYGVSIGSDTASTVISLKLDEVEKEMLSEN